MCAEQIMESVVESVWEGIIVLQPARYESAAS